MTLKPYPKTGNEPDLTTLVREWQDAGRPTAGRHWSALVDLLDLDQADREVIADNEHDYRREHGLLGEAAE